MSTETKTHTLITYREWAFSGFELLPDFIKDYPTLPDTMGRDRDREPIKRFNVVIEMESPVSAADFVNQYNTGADQRGSKGIRYTLYTKDLLASANNTKVTDFFMVRDGEKGTKPSLSQL